MKNKGLLFILAVIVGIAITSFVLYPDGSPGGRTGSPGDGGATCTGCHSGSSQDAANWITSDIPVSGYVPGQTYTITASATHVGAGKFGFEVTAEDLANAKKGTFVITDAAQTKKVNANAAVTHTSGGTTPSGDSKSWSFNWTAPASGTGSVKFYGAFNAANADGGTGGDQIYLSSLTVNEGTTGITENLAGMVDVQVYPNPFTDFLEISSGRLDVPASSIRINSQDGREVYSKAIADSGQDKIRVDAAGFAKGIYIVTVLFQDNRQASYKLVKN
jgi:hypothetical protein